MLNYYDFDIVFSPMNNISSEELLKLVATPEPSEQFERRKPHCLIFAADENIRFLYKTLLEIWHYDVTEAANLEEVFKLIAIKRPDVVLMDTSIKISESLHELKILKADQKLREIPFILLSGHAQAEVRKSALAAGANDFCVKPVDFNYLENVLKNYLA